MLDDIVSQVVTTKDYLVSSPFTGGSRREETNVSEILDWPVFVLRRQELLKKPFFYRSSLLSFEIDLSSVYSQFESKIETYATELLSEEAIVSGMLKQDFIVRMPPRKRYTIELELKSIRKAKPRIVEPEWI